jgi:hypothetical protein
VFDCKLISRYHQPLNSQNQKGKNMNSENNGTAFIARILTMQVFGDLGALAAGVLAKFIVKQLAAAAFPVETETAQQAIVAASMAGGLIAGAWGGYKFFDQMNASTTEPKPTSWDDHSPWYGPG